MRLDAQDIIGPIYDGHEPYANSAWARGKTRAAAGAVGGGIVTLALMGGGALVFAVLVIVWAVRTVLR